METGKTVQTIPHQTHYNSPQPPTHPGYSGSDTHPTQSTDVEANPPNQKPERNTSKTSNTHPKNALHPLFLITSNVQLAYPHNHHGHQ
jgi:hypothetical protein